MERKTQLSWWPRVTKSEFDKELPWKSKEILKFYMDTRPITQTIFFFLFFVKIGRADPAVDDGKCL